MLENILLLVVFLSQIFLISTYLPHRVIKRINSVLREHPQADYPKLYPAPLNIIENNLRMFQRMNVVVLGAGLAIVMHWAVSGSAQMLNWDSQSVILFYFMLQATPLVFLEVSGHSYLKLMRAANQSSTRIAILQPRRLFHYVSPIYIAIAIISYLAFILTVHYISLNPFDGFAGYVNIVGVTGLNLFFAAIAARQIYGKKTNPHQSVQDRNKQIKTVANIMVFSSIAATVFITINFLLASLELRHLNDVVQCIYFQIIMIVCLYKNTFIATNYDVYRNSGKD